jgi:hypothetical protein
MNLRNALVKYIVVSLSATASLVASQQTVASDDFDRGRSLTLKGAFMASLAPLGGMPVCLLVDVKEGGSLPAKWVIVGRDLATLWREGWTFGPSGTLRGGDELVIRVYLAKDPSNVAERLAAALFGSRATGLSSADAVCR